MRIKYFFFFLNIPVVCENQNIYSSCNDNVKKDRSRDGAEIKHEKLTDVFKEVTLHVRVEILLLSAQVLGERMKMVLFK